ncbi:hypothetical protein HKD37_08G023475 [Glycine soja]
MYRLLDVVMTSKNEGEAHIMKGFDGLELGEDLLVHLVLISLPTHFEQFKVVKCDCGEYYGIYDIRKTEKEVKKQKADGRKNAKVRPIKAYKRKKEAKKKEEPQPKTQAEIETFLPAPREIDQPRIWNKNPTAQRRRRNENGRIVDLWRSNEIWPFVQSRGILINVLDLEGDSGEELLGCC